MSSKIASCDGGVICSLPSDRVRTCHTGAATRCGKYASAFPPSTKLTGAVACRPLTATIWNVAVGPELDENVAFAGTKYANSVR